MFPHNVVFFVTTYYMAAIIYNIKAVFGVHDHQSALRGAAFADGHLVSNAYIIVENGVIAAVGPMSELQLKPQDFAFHFDATDCFVLPAWCDSHTHTVFAGSREEEFVQKLKGLSYAAIAASGGGIQSTAAQVAAASEEALFQLAQKRVAALMQTGTGALEIKSGYGLTVEAELKMLRVIKRLKENCPIPVKATFLAAHALPAAFKENRDGFIKMMLEEALPVVANEGLADFIDVFCEEGFFTPTETIRICEAGKKHGLLPKIHANQLAVSGGVQAGVRCNALSVDHLERMDESAITALAQSGTIGTLLPTAAGFLRMPFPPARILIDSGAAIALASDYNPGSSPSGNMNLVITLACIAMRMLPEEAINAATFNGACAMGIQNSCGSVTVGKLANLLVTQPVPSLAYIPYAFGQNHIQRVMINGEWI